MGGNKCANCSKGVMYGHNVSHAKNRTRKIFKPNLHKSRILIGTNRKTVKLCTKCLRMFKRMESGMVKSTAKSSEPVLTQPLSN